MFFQNLEDGLQAKRKVIERISELVGVHSDLSEQLKHVAYQTQEVKSKPHQLQSVISEIQQIKGSIQSWTPPAGEIDAACKECGLTMRDGSGKTTTARELMSSLETQVKQLGVQVGKVEETIQAVENRKASFEDIRSKVETLLKTAQDKLESVLLDITSPDEVGVALNKIQVILGDCEGISSAKEKLHGEGAILIEQDQSNIGSVQKTLTAIDADYDTLEENIRTKLKRLNEINSAWQSIGNSRKLLNGVFSDVKTALKGDRKDPAVLDSSRTKEDLANHKKCLEALKAAKTHLENIAGRSQIIKKLAEDLPNLDGREPAALLESLQKQWESECERVQKGIQDLEAQNILWEQIEAAKLDVFTWLRETGEGLQIGRSDPELAQIKSGKYKDDLSTYWNLKMSIQAKANQLIKNNPEKSPENLKALATLLDDEFTVLKEAADGLEELATSFNEQEHAVRVEIKKASEVISRIRESVVACDDLTGDNRKILERLNKVQSHQEDLVGFSEILGQVNQTLYDMKSNYPSFGESTLAKELGSLEKRYEVVVSHAEKVEKNLLAFLRKVYDEKFGAFQRLLLTLNEKIEWCLPEPNSDQYNLGLKITSLSDVENGIEECEKRKPELEESLQILAQVEGDEKINQLTFEKEKLVNDLEALKARCRNIGENLKKGAALWQSYEKLSEQVLSWLKDGEAKVRSESCGQVNLVTIAAKQVEMSNFLQEFGQHEAEVTALTALCAELVKECPESRAEQHSAQLNQRYQAVLKFFGSHLDRLGALQASREVYNASVLDAHKWLEESQQKLKEIENGLQSNTKNLSAFQKQVTELKDLEKTRESGMALLNTAVEKGEALFSGIVPENRETIRNELRALRSASEAQLDSANMINKKIESILLQRSSFDDNYSQVEKWLQDARAKLGPSYKLKATLQEKKQGLQSCRALHQDIASHKTIVTQLHDKMAPLSDEESSEKINAMLREYEDMLKTVEARMQTAEKHVLDHEKFLQSLEKTHDWLETLQTEVSPILASVGIEKEGAELKLDTLENVLRQKQDGDDLLAACKARLEPALEGTDPSGQNALLREYENQNTAWLDFLKKCGDMQNNLRSVCCRFTELEDKVEELVTWIKSQELQARDQSLKSTAPAKFDHLQKLRGFEKELAEKGEEFTAVVDKSHEVERDSELGVAIAKLVPRYQALKTTIRENISRYDTFAKEHAAFDENYRQLDEWLTKLEGELKEHSEVVGDLKVLQERQKRIREMGDIRAKETARFEQVVSAGEKLYAHTSPDGRELVRSQLRALRTRWDGSAESIQASLQQLDSCLLQFAEFTLQQEQLTEWLRDVERAMQRHTELRSGLPEKRAQLQNHRIMHQEISSHQSLVEGVCDKAQRLVEQTKDSTLNVYLASIKQLFRDIVVKSQALLDSLQSNVEQETTHAAHCTALADWLSAQVALLAESGGVAGEKADAERRLATVRSLRVKLTEGRALLATAEKSCAEVVKTTAPKGVQLAEKHLADLTESLASYERDIGKLITAFFMYLHLFLQLEKSYLHKEKRNKISHWFSLH